MALVAFCLLVVGGVTYFGSTSSLFAGGDDELASASRLLWREGAVGLRGDAVVADGVESDRSVEGTMQGSPILQPPRADAPVISVSDFLASREVCAYVTGRAKEPDIASILAQVRPEGALTRDDIDVVKRFEIDRSVDSLNPGTKADDALTFYRALWFGNSMLGDRLPRMTTPDYREGIRLLNELEARDSDNGVYAYYKIAMVHALGEDPEPEYRRFLEAKTWRTPAEDVLRSYENLGSRSPLLFFKAMSMYSQSDVPNSKPSSEWIRERVETMPAEEKGILDRRAEALMKDFLLRGSDAYTLPYAFMGRIRRTIGGEERPEYRPTHYFANRRKSYEPREFASAAEKLRADVCDDHDFIRVFDGAKLGFDTSIEF